MRLPAQGESAADQPAETSASRRTLVGGLVVAAVVASADPALAFEKYSDATLGFELKYATGLQKSRNDNYNLLLRDVIEPLESIAVKVSDTKRKSLDDVGDVNVVAQKFMDDVIPKGAPRELIKAETKYDKKGTRKDILEYRYQWKFDPETAAQVGKTRFQLRCKALIMIYKKREYRVIVANEDAKWDPTGDGLNSLPIDEFKLFY